MVKEAQSRRRSPPLSSDVPSELIVAKAVDHGLSLCCWFRIQVFINLLYEYADINTVYTSHVRLLQ